MPFIKNGTPHWNGVIGENQVKEFLNDRENIEFVSMCLEEAFNAKFIYVPDYFDFINKGGTKNINDLESNYYNIGISLKSKKVSYNKNDEIKYSGSFDLINSSIKNIYQYADSQSEFFTIIKQYNDYIENIKSNNDSINRSLFESKINTFCVNLKKSLKFQDIYRLLQIVLYKYRNTILLIRDYFESPYDKIYYDDMHFFNINWLVEELKQLKLDQPFNSQYKSELIQFEDNNNSFRLRVSLNNGISALSIVIGKEDENDNDGNEPTEGKKSSSIVIKIQVEKIEKLVEKYDVQRKVLNKLNQKYNSQINDDYQENEEDDEEEKEKEKKKKKINKYEYNR